MILRETKCSEKRHLPRGFRKFQIAAKGPAPSSAISMKIRARVPGHERTLRSKSQLYWTAWTYFEWRWYPPHITLHAWKPLLLRIVICISAANEAVAYNKSSPGSSSRELLDFELPRRSWTAPEVEKLKILFFSSETRPFFERILQRTALEHAMSVVLSIRYMRKNFHPNRFPASILIFKSRVPDEVSISTICHISRRRLHE